MKERGMLFGAPMVRATLDDRKTQTRRVMSKQFDSDAVMAEVPATTPEGWMTSGHSGLWWDDAGSCIDDAVRSPYGVPGDRIWAKETWRYHGAMGSATPGIMSEIYISYVADGVRRTVLPNGEALPLPKQPQQREGEIYSFRDASAEEIDRIINGEKTYTDRLSAWWRRDIPSIFMYRWASRITLEITNVRVERLQAINEADAIAEGVESLRDEGVHFKNYLTSTADCDEFICASARDSYCTLWQSLYGAASWDANPWVWVYEFKRVTP